MPQAGSDCSEIQICTYSSCNHFNIRDKVVEWPNGWPIRPPHSTTSYNFPQPAFFFIVMEKYELGRAKRRQRERSLSSQFRAVSSLWTYINWPSYQPFGTAFFFFLIWCSRVVLPTKHLLHTACEAHGNVPCSKSVKAVMHVNTQCIFAILRFSTCHAYRPLRKKKKISGIDCILFRAALV